MVVLSVSYVNRMALVWLEDEKNQRVTPSTLLHPDQKSVIFSWGGSQPAHIKHVVIKRGDYFRTVPLGPLVIGPGTSIELFIQEGQVVTGTITVP